MRFVVGFLSAALAVGGGSAGAQSGPPELLIRGGRVIDPGNSRDAVMDVAISGGRISRVASDIPATEGMVVIDARGLLVVPGLVDIHVHAFHGTDPGASYSDGPLALPPDGFTFRSGVTTAVDTGGAGWRNFPQFKRQVIDQARTRVLAMLNIVGSGMKGDPVEQDLRDMDARLTALQIRRYRDLIVGVKVAHYLGPEWDPVDRAVEAATLADVPVMVDFGRHTPPLPLRELLLTHLRPGDILTHCYAHVEGREPLVGADGRLQRFASEARQRGVIFDVGHGAGSFLFRQAIPAVQQGFLPDTISTDLHVNSINAGMKDILNVASKFLNMGVPVPDVIRMMTVDPARVIRRDDLGRLSESAEADVALLRLVEGEFGFLDVESFRFRGTRKLECEMTIRGGRVVWDLNGRAGTDWGAPGAGSGR
jgi:dihydroorotase